LLKQHSVNNYVLVSSKNVDLDNIKTIDCHTSQLGLLFY
jgi:hypothetical protein